MTGRSTLLVGPAFSKPHLKTLENTTSSSDAQSALTALSSSDHSRPQGYTSTLPRSATTQEQASKPKSSLDPLANRLRTKHVARWLPNFSAFPGIRQTAAAGSYKLRDHRQIRLHLRNMGNPEYKPATVLCRKPVSGSPRDGTAVCTSKHFCEVGPRPSAAPTPFRAASQIPSRVSEPPQSLHPHVPG